MIKLRVILPTLLRLGRNTSGAPGVQCQRALQLSTPAVQPHWILACHTEKSFAHQIYGIHFLILFRMVPIGSFYLGASSTTSSPAFRRPESMSQASSPFPTSPPLIILLESLQRDGASMPAPARGGRFKTGLWRSTSGRPLVDESRCGICHWRKEEATTRVCNEDSMREPQLQRA